MSFADSFNTYGYNPPINQMEVSNFSRLKDISQGSVPEDYKQQYLNNNQNFQQSKSNFDPSQCGCQVIVGGVPQNSSSLQSQNSQNIPQSQPVNNKGQNPKLQSSDNDSPIGSSITGVYLPIDNSNDKLYCGDYMCAGQIGIASSSTGVNDFNESRDSRIYPNPNPNGNFY